MKDTPYDASFFDHQSTNSRIAASIVLKRLQDEYVFQSVMDVGCGVGTWISACIEMGLEDVCGVDGDYVEREKLQIPQEVFFAADLNEPLTIGRKFDLVTSLEVAEHLDKDRAENFVAGLVKHSDAILFSAAIPLQGGTHHVNEQWGEYWQNIFASFEYEPVDFLRDALWHNENIPFWYRQNMCFFRNKNANRPILPNRPATEFLSRIHPDFYARIVTKAKNLTRKDMRKMRKDYRQLLDAS